MFQDKNTNDKKNDQSDFNSLAPDAPIHLMKTDLEEIKNPKKALPSTPLKAMDQQSANFSEKQKTSPFFNPAKNQEIAVDKPKESVKLNPSSLPKEPTQEIKKERQAPISTFFPKEHIQETKKEAPKEIVTSVFSQPKDIKKELQKKSGESFSLNKIINIFAIFFFLLIIGASGYYFWTTKNIDQDQPSENQPTATQPEENQLTNTTESITQSEKIIDFSTEKINYFSLDITTADKASVTAQLDAYLKKAEEIKMISLAEFIVTDLSNNPVSFKIFSEKIGLALSPQTMSALKDTFSLFIFNDNGNYRLGIAIDSSNSTNLKAAMLKEEPDLVATLDSLLKNPENKELIKKDFALDIYKKVNIRFANIVSPEYLSIDYAIFQKKLVIVTTKAMSRAVIDYLTPKTVTTEPTPITSVKTTEKKLTQESSTTTSIAE